MEANTRILREEELYALWENSAAPGVAFQALAGERILVISPGARNDIAGPDYRDAVLLIDGRLAVGPVEMHRTEAEWFAHGHQDDAAYDGVILHVLGDPAISGRLAIPSIDAEALRAAVVAHGDASGDASANPDAAGVSVHPPEAPRALTPDFLAELAWTRLLRRVTEIVRSEPGRPTPERLRRAFVRRLLDALGYASNRAPMAAIAEIILENESELSAATFDGIAALMFAASGLEREKVAAAGRAFLSESRLLRILKNHDLPAQVAEWRYDTRPANAPERRVWGAAKLVYEIYHNDLLLRLHRSVLSGTYRSVAEPLNVRLGSSAFVGAGRTREIVINALLPVALASGILVGDRMLVEGACALYRAAPASGANRLVRRVEERFLGGARLDGAFWQQGAIEFHQRYLLPDRSGLSFVAEPGHTLRPPLRHIP